MIFSPRHELAGNFKEDLVIIYNMRRIFVLFICMLALSAHSQKVDVDRIESDGRHQIMTTSRDFYVDDAEYRFTMKIYESAKGLDWHLLISSFSYIPSSAEVLLKLGNGDLMYLPCNNVTTGSVTKPGYGVSIIRGFTEIYPSREKEYYSSIYDLTPEMMDKIAEFGIKKIRISTGVKYRDEVFRGNPLGKFIVRCRKNIQERLDNPPKKKNLYDDF